MTRRALPLLVLGALCAGGWDMFKTSSRAVEEGNARLREGKAAEALALYDRAALRLPGDPALHFDRGAALFALKRFDEASKEFLRATEAKAPELKAQAFYNLGNTFFKKNQLKEAVEAYKRSLVLDPRDVRAKWNLELALRRRQESDEQKQQPDDQGGQKGDGSKDAGGRKDDKRDDKKEHADDKKEAARRPGDREKDEGGKGEPPPQASPAARDQGGRQRPDEPPGAEKGESEIEAILDGLDKPKNLELERAKGRAARREPPAKDW